MYFWIISCVSTFTARPVGHVILSAAQTHERRRHRWARTRWWNCEQVQCSLLTSFHLLSDSPLECWTHVRDRVFSHTENQCVPECAHTCPLENIYIYIICALRTCCLSNSLHDVLMWMYHNGNLTNINKYEILRSRFAFSLSCLWNADFTEEHLALNRGGVSGSKRWNSSASGAALRSIL